MILDNENENLKVHQWISRYTQTGKLSVVTGYFTVGALAYLSRATQSKIDEYRFILGDIVNFDAEKDRALNLLNEEISIDASLKLSKVAKEAVEFLELEKVVLSQKEHDTPVYKKPTDDSGLRKGWFAKASMEPFAKRNKAGICRN